MELFHNGHHIESCPLTTLPITIQFVLIALNDFRFKLNIHMSDYI